MNNLFVILPLFLGLTVVTQGLINRRISADWGLASAVFLNATVFFILSLILMIVAVWAPPWLFENIKGSSIDFSKMKFWFLIPGICGFLLVLGVPWSLQVNGPSKTFILLIVSQIVCSLIAEKLFFSAQLSSVKLIGAVIVVLGAVLVSYN